MATEERQTRAAHNQALFRSINESVRAVSESGVPSNETIGFLCECADTSCTQTINLTLAEYESARQVPTHFPIAVSHEWPDVERVVERYKRYEVVEKFGEAAKAAEEIWRESSAEND